MPIVNYVPFILLIELSTRILDLHPFGCDKISGLNLLNSAILLTCPPWISTVWILRILIILAQDSSFVYLRKIPVFFRLLVS